MKKIQIGLNDLDKHAYSIICRWPEAIGFSPIYKGIDYSLIIRFYLWDKVGRALRIKHGIDYGEVEIYTQEYLSFPQYYKAFRAKGTYKKPFLKWNKTVFIPYQAPHTKKLIKRLQAIKGVRVLSKQKGKAISKKYIIQSPPISDIDPWHHTLFKSVLAALQSYSITLIEDDQKLLQQQLKGVVKMTLLAEQELKKNKPNAVYVHSDNHPPFITYVLAAKKLGIPTFTYQHGLDCEHYILDDSFADYVGVWGENRKKRYVRDSRYKAKSYQFIGNVFLSIPEPKTPTPAENTLLYVSRPHKPIKCYAPSRNYLEGVEILTAILEFMKQHTAVRLIIKPHPLDLVNAYEKVILEHGFENRVTIAAEPLRDLFSKATIVVTEDTTAGAEAMYYQLPCVHAHFANSEPVLPFVDYGCALPGRTAAQLKDSLHHIVTNSDPVTTTNKERDTFIRDFIPKGNMDDLVTFIINNLT